MPAAGIRVLEELGMVPGAGRTKPLPLRGKREMGNNHTVINTRIREMKTAPKRCQAG